MATSQQLVGDTVPPLTPDTSIVTANFEHPQRHPEFYSPGMIVVQVENTLYKVDQRLLCQFEFLRDMFEGASQFNTNKGEGQSDVNPIRLDAISSFEFESILRICEPKRFFKQSPGITLDEWKAILHLSTMWSFEELREHAIREIESIKPPPVDLILLARRCQVEKWLRPAYLELCKRPETITADEGRLLGIDLFAALCHIRERRCLMGAHDLQLMCPHCNHSNTAGRCHRCNRASVYQQRCHNCDNNFGSNGYNADPSETEKAVDLILTTIAGPESA
ncbi:hypothetical protein FRC02_010101 [Tulasnella sp. 418]|nr:hypothetical protein FRC02_010101 [Tulasnella sp. 418]